MTQTAITSENSVASATDGQVGHIKGLLDPTLRRLSKPAAQAIIGAGNVLQQLFEAFVFELVGKLTSTYPVTVDYTKSLPEMIKAGKYGYDYVPGDTPISGRGKVELGIVLVHFDKNMSANDAEVELNKLGLRSATLPELLAFGERYPDVQREFPIYALFRVVDRNCRRRVPVLSHINGERCLGIFYYGNTFNAESRFAAVRK